MEEIIKFKLVPQYEKYYSDDTNWGCYTFTTSDDIPEYDEYKNPFLDENEDIKKMSIIAGRMQRLCIGTEYEVSAKLEYNKRYKNYQYNPSIVSAIVPKSVDDQKKFLESILTRNQANTLLEVYPNIVLDVINGNCNIDLNKTKGIKEYTWNIIKQKIIENYVISDILILLQPLGITYTMIKLLLSNEPNPELLKQKLNDNPYLLTRIHGLGFKRVDGLALKLRPDLEVSSKRTYAFIQYFLEDIGESIGHTWVDQEVLASGIRDNIPECEEKYEEIIEIEKEFKAFLYIEDNKVGLKYYRRIEESVFNKLKELNTYKKEWDIDIEKGIKEAELEQGFEFTEEQIEVIKKAINENVVLISGKAGSGKSTISRALLKIYQNYNIGCAALSAKAAQRIIEATGFPASTIHRLIGAKGLSEFLYNADNPLPYDIVLIDECSMINARLYNDLLQAVKLGVKIIMCGDDKQLPPIGYGNIFSNLLEMKEHFNVNQLFKVLRQAEQSGILSDANKIREGINPIERPEFKITHGEIEDMFYMFRDNRDALNNIAIKMFLKSIEEDSLDDVVIITPRKADCTNCTKEINIQIQDLLIDNNKPYLIKGDIKFKLGAKVIQRVNNYEKNIFNGEIGYIVDIFREKEIDKEYNMFTVEYPGKTILYKKSELDEIDLAYAMTVHLTQGSGYKTVIGIVDNTHFTLLDSCLLYTLITRAKKRCLLLAEPSAFKRCIDNNKSIERQTWLKILNLQN
jgi:exodeoxyribonuclease V alpha subunit